MPMDYAATAPRQPWPASQTRTVVKAAPTGNIPAMATAAVPVIILALAASACVLAAGGLSPASLGLALVVAGLGGVLARWAALRCGAAVSQACAILRANLESDAAARPADSVIGLDKLCQGVLPVWSGQVEMARGHTEESVTDLAGRFARINERIAATAAASEGSDSGQSLIRSEEHTSELQSH